MQKIIYAVLLSIFCTFPLMIMPSLNNIYSEPGFLLNETEQSKIKNSLPNKKYIFLVDLHGVLTDLMVFQAILCTFKRCFNSFNQAYLTIMFFIHFGYKRFFDKRYYGNCGEELIKRLIKEYPEYKEYLDHYYVVANMQGINKKFFDILQKLKKEGHILLLASNVGKETLLKSLDKNLSKELAKAMALFHGYIIAYEDQQTNIIISKPREEFFFHIIHSLKKYYAQDLEINNENVIFIDDNPENIQIAKNLKIKSILYQTPQKFLQDLKKLKIQI